MPPRYAVRAERDKQAAVALVAGAVHGEIISMVKAPGGVHDSVWMEVSPEPEHAYDPEWAVAELRRSLVPLDRGFAVSRLPAGETVERIVSSRVLKRADGRAHTRLLAGIKTEGKVTVAEFAEYGNRFEEEAFLARNPDAHGLLYGFYGTRDLSVSLGAQFRTGDFVIEFEHEWSDELPLLASRTFLDVLEQLGVVLERDVRVMFNGHRSLVVRVRQSAVGLQNCVELPSLYGRFAEALWARMQGAMNPDVGVPYDSNLYTSNSSYRIAGCVHQETGFCATPTLTTAPTDTACLSNRAQPNRSLRSLEEDISTLQARRTSLKYALLGSV